MYQNFRGLLLNVVPGTCFSDFIYLGMIVFIIAGLLSSKKWTPFIAVFTFAFIFKAFDLLFLHQLSRLVIEQFLHLIMLPLVLTFLYVRKD